LANDLALSIGDLAARAGTKVETIRYYEKVGILPAAARTAGNHRTYTQAHADRLAFIRHSRELGFPVDSIRSLLTIADDPARSCTAVDAIARDHLTEVQSRIARLQALEAELMRMVQECGQGRVANCRVIEVLADHSHGHCLGTNH
jgi:DNA-binding transcriptional MerR regulator